MLEKDYQAKLIKKIKKRLPDSIVMKEDANYKQGIPDLIVLNQNNWAALEVKKSENASKRPNQEYYVDKMNSMSFASFIYPENEEDVLNAMEQALKR
jgi:hypothetical protein